MNSRKKVVAVTSIVTAVSLLVLSCILDIDLLVLPFCILGIVSAAAFMSEEKHVAIGWLLLFFVFVVTISRMIM